MTVCNSNDRILQRATSDFLHRATSVRVTSDFLERADFATSNTGKIS